jgi:hypothetical protein
MRFPKKQSTSNNQLQTPNMFVKETQTQTKSILKTLDPQFDMMSAVLAECNL